MSLRAGPELHAPLAAPPADRSARHRMRRRCAAHCARLLGSSTHPLLREAAMLGARPPARPPAPTAARLSVRACSSVGVALAREPTETVTEAYFEAPPPEAAAVRPAPSPVVLVKTSTSATPKCVPSPCGAALRLRRPRTGANSGPARSWAPRPPAWP